MKRSYCLWPDSRPPRGYVPERLFIAPFWSDIELGRSTFKNGNRLYYGTYRFNETSMNNVSRSIFTNANKMVKSSFTVTTFDASWVLIATWNQVTPYRADDHFWSNKVGAQLFQVRYYYVLLFNQTVIPYCF